MNIDFDSFVSKRTAAMSTVVLQALGVGSLVDKKVLLFGSGKIATESLKILNFELGLTNIDVINRTRDFTNIRSEFKESNLSINAGFIKNIGKYDIIIAHTQTAEPLISNAQLTEIKQGAFLASFISSTEHGEFPDEIYDGKKANIIIDWEQTLVGAKDLKRALEAHKFDEHDLIYLKYLLSGKAIDQNKQYTVYRSTGTPIQNLAALKLLV